MQGEESWSRLYIAFGARAFPTILAFVAFARFVAIQVFVFLALPRR